MKRTILLIAVIALAAFAVWIVVSGQGTPTAGGGTGTVNPGTTNPGATNPGAVGTGGDAGIPAPGDAERMEVLSITDGDTLRLRDATGAVENVRLVGIDTPEVYPVYECYGDEAEAELLSLAPLGSTLLAATDVDPFDDYDRLLLYLWNDDDVFINLALVEGGYAEAIRVAPNDAWYDELLDAENSAARADRGMWGAC